MNLGYTLAAWTLTMAAPQPSLFCRVGDIVLCKVEWELEPSDFKRLPLKDEDSDNWIWRPVVFRMYCERNRQ